MAGKTYDRPLIDKLGVRPGARVCVLGVRDETFRATLRERTTDVHERARRESDLIFLLAPTGVALQRLTRLVEYIKPEGAIWVVAPKGRAGVPYGEIAGSAKAAGLVDVKVVAFSRTHTSLKLVIPLARRGLTRAPRGGDRSGPRSRAGRRVARSERR